MVANLFMKFGADTTEYQKKMRAAVTRMLFVAESLTQAGRIMSTAITAPMIMVGVASLKTAMQFEAAMTRMVSLVGMPAETIARWKPVVQEMAGVVGKSANELAEALFFITSNGIRTDAALRVLEATAKASAVGMGETKDIAIAATSALNAFGEGALTADESVAVLIGTVREGNLEAAELPAALSKLLPIAAAMGIEFHEAGAGIAAMSRSGTSARLAAFGLRAIMMGLLAPTTGAAKAMDDVDLSAAKLRETLAQPNGLRTALFQIAEATKTGNTTLKDVLPNQRAYTAALQLIGKNSEDYITISENMAKVVGEDVNDAFDKGADTMDRTYKQAMGNLSSAAIDLGNNMAPLIDKFAELAAGASKTAKAYNELSDFQKSLVNSLAFTAVAVGPLTYALGSLARMSARVMGMSIMTKAPWAKAAAGFAAPTAAVNMWTSSLSKVGLTLPVVGLAVATFWASFKLSKVLDDAVGTTKALNEEFGRFGTATVTIGDDLAKGGKRMEEMTDKSVSLARKIGEVTLANELMDARMAGNYNEMGRIITKIDALANAYNRVTISVNGMTTAQQEAADSAEAIKDANDELALEEDERLLKLRQLNKLLTSQDVKDSMLQMVNDRKDLINLGIPLEEINKQQIEDYKELGGWVNTYKMAATEGFRAIGQSMQDQMIPGAEKIHELFDFYIPQAINMMPGKILPGMVKIGDEVAERLTGGLSKGFTDSHAAMDTFNTRLAGGITTAYHDGVLDFGEKIFVSINESVERMGPIEIDLVPNLDAFMNIYDDIKNGKYPDTGG
jgi:TP901 family phage tail tape measure protein